MTKNILSKLSLTVRAGQLKIMLDLTRPTPQTQVLDVGFAPREDLPDTNYFEKFYPFPNSLTAASTEDCRAVKSKYPGVNIVRIQPGKKLPFRNNHFEIATSWATLEHVGNYQQQEFFLNELLRVAHKIFVTTPYRGSPYEPHTGFFFLQWLPLNWFRKICLYTGRRFWAKTANLNPLWVRDIKSMRLTKPVVVSVYQTLKFIPSHLLITSV